MNPKTLHRTKRQALNLHTAADPSSAAASSSAATPANPLPSPIAAHSLAQVAPPLRPVQATPIAKPPRPVAGSVPLAARPSPAQLAGAFGGGILAGGAMIGTVADPAATMVVTGKDTAAAVNGWSASAGTGVEMAKGSMGSAAFAGDLLSGVAGGVTAISEGVGAYQAVKRGDYVGAAGASLASVAGATQSGLGIASMATSVASTAAPGLGIAVGSINAARGGYGVYKSQRAKSALEAQQAALTAAGDADTAGVAAYAANVQRKTRNRQALNATAGGLQIAGGITAVASGATGIGAAVGGGIMAAGAVLKPGAALTRYAQKKGRDRAAADPTSHFNKVFDANKSSEKKQAANSAMAAKLAAGHTRPDMQMIFKNLPGVSGKELRAYSAGQLSEAQIAKMMKRRE